MSDNDMDMNKKIAGELLYPAYLKGIESAIHVLQKYLEEARKELKKDET